MDSISFQKTSSELLFRYFVICLGPFGGFQINPSSSRSLMRSSDNFDFNLSDRCFVTHLPRVGSLAGILGCPFLSIRSLSLWR